MRRISSASRSTHTALRRGEPSPKPVPGGWRHRLRRTRISFAQHIHERRDPSALVLFVRPAGAVTRRGKSSGEPGRRDPKGTARRPPARGALKEAGREPARRRTGTGYEATPSRTSGQTTAKCLRPRSGGVDPAVVRGRPRVLPGEISRVPERATPFQRREKSAAAIVARAGEGPNGRERATPGSLQDARRQKSRQLELPLGGRGEALRAERSGEASRAAGGTVRSGTDHLLERVVERGNLQGALKRAPQNQGSRRMNWCRRFTTGCP